MNHEPLDIKVIFLNGPSSSGKTSLAKALQAKLPEPYLHIGIDRLIGMMPEHLNSWTGSSKPMSGFSFTQGKDSTGHLISQLQVGPYAEKICDLLQALAITMLNQGFYLIIDEICLRENSFQIWQKILAPYSTFYVGVQASLDVLESREKQRGDRILGSARSQNSVIHQDKNYDLVIDTSRLTISEGADFVLKNLPFSKTQNPYYFQDLTLQDAEKLATSFKKIGWHKPLAGFLTYIKEAETGLRKNIVAKNLEGEVFGYVTVLWESDHPYFQERQIPEIKDLNVLPEFQKQGFGRALLNAAEQAIYQKLGPDQTIGIGVGILKDYGPAQRLYIQEGYIPNGEGVTVNHQALNYGHTGTADDDWVLWMLKKPRKPS
jgi:chloramphenicol 3-O phosphotransferase